MEIITFVCVPTERVRPYPIFLNLAIEGSQTNLEQSGCLSLVAMRMLKHLGDLVPLYALEVKGVIRLRGSLARKHIYGEVMIGNFTVSHDQMKMKQIPTGA